MSPRDAVPSSGTDCPACTMAGVVNCATGARGVKPAPLVVSVEVSEPPALEVTFTNGGGAVTPGKFLIPAVSGPRPTTVRAGRLAPVSVSLDVAVTLRALVSALYVAAEPQSCSTMVLVF